jgi:peptide/nickel transport system ATP-binding protein
VMYLGRVVEMAETVALFARPVHPYTRALLQSVLTPEPGLGIPETGLGLAFPDPLDPPPGCPFHPRCPDAVGICRLTMPPLVQTVGGVAACHVHAPAQGARAA